jgi:hypothetical protein
VADAVIKALDAILGNETELAILEHTTDTAGATEIIFALFDLLGLRFTPRLRDIGSRRLYRSGAIDLHHYPRLQPHITGRINRQRVLDWWDDMLRAAGSMKLAMSRLLSWCKSCKRIRSKTRWRRRSRNMAGWSGPYTCSGGMPTMTTGVGSCGNSIKVKPCTISART